MDQFIRRILKDFNPTVLDKLEETLKLRVTNFKRDLFPSLVEIDLLVPGAGFQYTIWVEHEPFYPFPGWEYDALARPMRYIPTYLASGMKFIDIARSIARDSGGHTEECVKAYCEKILPTFRGYGRMPLGTLAQNKVLKASLGIKLTESISVFADVLVNKAKHEYFSGRPEPIISFPDALGGYFVSRILGYQVLEKAGIFEEYMNAIKKAHIDKMCYTFPSRSNPGDDNDFWPLLSDLTDDDDHDYI